MVEVPLGGRVATMAHVRLDRVGIELRDRPRADSAADRESGSRSAPPYRASGLRRQRARWSRCPPTVLQNTSSSSPVRPPSFNPATVSITGASSEQQRTRFPFGAFSPLSVSCVPTCDQAADESMRFHRSAEQFSLSQTGVRRDPVQRRVLGVCGRAAEPLYLVPVEVSNSPV